jgi:hypothetical protein
MGVFCARFSFDIFRSFLRKGVFLRHFLTAHKIVQAVLQNQSFYFGPTWPEVRAGPPKHSGPGCRSPPRSIHQSVNPAEQSANTMNGGIMMDKPLVTIKYKTANGSEICVEVSNEVKELLAQSDRQIQSQRRQDRRHLDYMDSIDGLTDVAMSYPQEDAADLLIRIESYRQLYAAVNRLSTVQRRRLLLHFSDNLSYRQIADLEGVNQSAVGYSIKRALNQLYKCLTD